MFGNVIGKREEISLFSKVQRIDRVNKVDVNKQV